MCNKTFLDKEGLTRHQKNSHITRAQLNCNECDFQGNSEPELKKHLNIKSHKGANGVKQAELKECETCNICKEEFNEWWLLMNHRRDVHPERRRKCRNFLKNECNFEDDECWWKHQATLSKDQKYSNDLEKEHDCTVCEEMFLTKSQMMIHKKMEHEELVPICNSFKRGKCDFPATKCWYRHLMEPRKPETLNQKASWDFQIVENQAKPPETELEELKKIVNQAVEMIKVMSKKMETKNN